MTKATDDYGCAEALGKNSINSIKTADIVRDNSAVDFGCIQDKIPDYSSLGISSDFMFGKIMSAPEIARVFLEQILGLKIDHVEILERQKGIDEKPDARSVRLDIY